MTQPIHERFRAEPTAACSWAVDNPCVLLSETGLDSGSILAAMLETGLDLSGSRVPLRRATRATTRSTPWPGTRQLCPQAPFHVVEVPRSLSQAHDIATWCIETSGSVLKTAIEVMVPMRLLSTGHRPRLPHACSGNERRPALGRGSPGDDPAAQCQRRAWRRRRPEALAGSQASAGSNTSAPASRRTRRGLPLVHGHSGGCGTIRSPSWSI